TAAVLTAAVFGAGVVFAAPNVPTPRAKPATTKPAASTTHTVAVPLPRKRPHIAQTAQTAQTPRFEAIAKTAPTSNNDPIALLTQGKPIAEVAALPYANETPALPPVESAPAVAKVPPVGGPPTVASVPVKPAPFTGHMLSTPLARPTTGPFAAAPTRETPASDVAGLKRLIEAIRGGRAAEADTIERGLSDPVARKLAEWIILRSDATDAGYARYAAFIDANPAWPHVALFRRRAENALWDDKADDATVRAFFARRQPTTAKGRYVLARALLAQGDRAGATALVREAWRTQDCSAEVERRVLEIFGDIITPSDNKARMNARLYADDAEAGMRAAERLGGNEPALARAWAAVVKRQHNAKALLDAVPAAARAEPGYFFARASLLRRENKPEEAGRVILSAPRETDGYVDTNQWWIERRLVIRKLLDDHDAQTAYRIARDAASPKQGNYRVDQHFTAGWIALRFLHDPKTAMAHFAHILEGTHNPHALSRGGYWLGRAADAAGEHGQARAYYEQAAKYSATYYGQLARARAGLPDLGLHGAAAFSPQERQSLASLEVVRAAELLYELNERDMIASMYAELGESAHDVAGMAMLGELAHKHGDGRAMVLLGSGGYGRGLPLDYYAYPVVGLPKYAPIAPPIEEAVAYSIARQESHFNQKVVSIAHAMGLMQVTPEAAQDTAKKFKAVYNRARLLSDPVYNMQMGAAELSNLLTGYNGSYILTFAGYNAGRGRVRQWIAAFGDPRDRKVDPVDWVERIPISETRNYVQRIMENLQVYRA
ncbi:MAG: transglycosylase SLT domain-containing protein, partial [Pseudolabrys sp.]